MKKRAARPKPDRPQVGEKFATFSLPFMGRVVEAKRRPGGEGVTILVSTRTWPRRVDSLAAPTRLRPVGLSHPPHKGEGEHQEP
ncbi:hypothetical protein HMPREF0185_03176 [Brevundimonas diminuta 470-4]|nr:hypothetical protein HMPREF0185_03176 [Brevundimonas diminuta 470-4]